MLFSCCFYPFFTVARAQCRCKQVLRRRSKVVMKVEAWLFRRCPRCGGDILVDGNGHQRRATCIQCGYEEYEGQEFKRPDVAELVLPTIGSSTLANPR